MLDGCVGWPEELAARYRAEGYWRGEVLGDLGRELARSDPDRTALVAGDQRVGYGELDRRADRLAAGLRARGIGRHDRVVVQLPNSVEFVVVCLALFRLGALPVLALPAHRRAEIGHLCAHTEAVAYLTVDQTQGFDLRKLAAEVRAETPSLREVFVVGDPGEFTALAQVDADPVPLPRPDPAEVAFFLLSGGSTGVPKLIPRTHDDYAYQLRATAAAMGFGADGVYLAALPAAHNAALGCPGVLGALHAGGTAVLAGSPSPDEAFRLIAREKVTLTTLMPAFLPLWADLAPLLGADLSGLVVEVGGANLSPEVATRAVDELGIRLTHFFGMAEGPIACTRPDDPPERAAHTQGRPLSAADEFRVVDSTGAQVAAGEVGELVVGGPTTLRGYYRAADYNAHAFTPDGLLRTGDLVRWTPTGELVVVGRIKEVVNRGGEKVPAGEVEEHLLAHPGVREVAVLAVPDRALGEKTCAVVVPHDAAPTLGELREFLTGRGLAGFKLPDRLQVRAALPYTGVGKVDKRALSAELTT
ncbi:AMP-binding protein [Micromonospora sp. NPDC050980]|uniref:(2,3-dihydroxybenzoyl)adenylate synthase n=1 Tax=Micromonospora sp. NPDC050980 TaxID=3155161 RepID=UPI0033C5287F